MGAQWPGGMHFGVPPPPALPTFLSCHRASALGVPRRLAAAEMRRAPPLRAHCVRGAHSTACPVAIECHTDDAHLAVRRALMGIMCLGLFGLPAVACGLLPVFLIRRITR